MFLLWQCSNNTTLWDRCGRLKKMSRWATRWFLYQYRTAPRKRLRKVARLDKLPDWLCFSLQGHSLHLYLFVSADLTGAMKQKRWHLVSTNEKWQMHKSFRLCCVEISAWHSLRLFGDSTGDNLHGSPRNTHAITDVLKWTTVGFKLKALVIKRPSVMKNDHVKIHIAKDLTSGCTFLSCVLF